MFGRKKKEQFNVETALAPLKGDKLNMNDLAECLYIEFEKVRALQEQIGSLEEQIEKQDKIRVESNTKEVLINKLQHDIRNFEHEKSMHDLDIKRRDSKIKDFERSIGLKDAEISKLQREVQSLKSQAIDEGERAKKRIYNSVLDDIIISIKGLKATTMGKNKIVEILESMKLVQK